MSEPLLDPSDPEAVPGPRWAIGGPPTGSRGLCPRAEQRGGGSTEREVTPSTLRLLHPHAHAHREPAGPGGKAGTPETGAEKGSRETGEKISQTPKAEQKKLFPEALRSWPPAPYSPVT